MAVELHSGGFDTDGIDVERGRDQDGAYFPDGKSREMDVVGSRGWECSNEAQESVNFGSCRWRHLQGSAASSGRVSGAGFEIMRVLSLLDIKGSQRQTGKERVKETRSESVVVLPRSGLQRRRRTRDGMQVTPYCRPSALPDCAQENRVARRDQRSDALGECQALELKAPRLDPCRACHWSLGREQG